MNWWKWEDEKITNSKIFEKEKIQFKKNIIEMNQKDLKLMKIIIVCVILKDYFPTYI